MSVFELSVYSPTIEETGKKSGISRLKINGPLDQKWQEPLRGRGLQRREVSILTR
jgi:hypothetical protein